MVNNEINPLEYAYVSFLRFMFEKQEVQESFKKETNHDLSEFLLRSPIEAMIDETTKYEASVMSRFIVWITDNWWDSEENSMKLETYRKAKEYLNNRN